MNSVFHQPAYRKPSVTEGMVKIQTVFGIRYVTAHDWAARGRSVEIAIGDDMTQPTHESFIVGEFPQPHRAIRKRRMELLAATRSSATRIVCAPPALKRAIKA